MLIILLYSGLSALPMVSGSMMAAQVVAAGSAIVAVEMMDDSEGKN